MQAQLGLSEAWLASGDFENAGVEADRFLQSALSTADPNLQVLAWELQARVAIAHKDCKAGEEFVQKALAILAKIKIPSAAWRLHGTAWDLYQQVKNHKAAETQKPRRSAPPHTREFAPARRAAPEQRPRHRSAR